MGDVWFDFVLATNPLHLLTSSKWVKNAGKMFWQPKQFILICKLGKKSRRPFLASPDLTNYNPGALPANLRTKWHHIIHIDVCQEKRDPYSRWIIYLLFVCARVRAPNRSINQLQSTLSARAYLHILRGWNTQSAARLGKAGARIVIARKEKTRARDAKLAAECARTW